MKRKLSLKSDDGVPIYSSQLSYKGNEVAVITSIFGWTSGTYWNVNDVKKVHEWLGEFLKKEAKK